MGYRRRRLFVTHLWRISIRCDLEGLGGEYSDGRWHTAAPGKRLVYLSEHPALALLETLVNMRGEPNQIPSTFQLLKVIVPERIVTKELDRMQLRINWDRSRAATQTFGDTWLAEAKSALLRIPAAPAPESWNYLLNPLHPEASLIEIDWCRRITYDNRLLGFRERP
jgi:RES domain-containing protein